MNATATKTAVSGDDYLPRHAPRTLSQRIDSRRRDNQAAQGQLVGCDCEVCGYVGKHREP